MGAEDFIVSAKGKTAEKAFAAAQEEARYESGHGGYTGTIAEVSSFRMTNVEKEAEWALNQLAEKAKYLTVKGQQQLKQELKVARDKDDWDAVDRIQRNNIYVMAGETIADACKRMRESNRDQVKALKGKRSRPQAVIRAMFDFDHPKMTKWICNCIETKKGEFIFFGWASS